MPVRLVDQQMVLNALAGTDDQGVPYPPPTANAMPVQESAPDRSRTPAR